jgi:hypothetical protein
MLYSAFLSILHHSETGQPEAATEAALRLECLSSLPGLDDLMINAAQILARRCQLLADGSRQLSPAYSTDWFIEP